MNAHDNGGPPDPEMGNVRFILLMRHARHEANKPNASGPKRVLTRQGFEETKAVLDRLVSHMEEGEDGLRLAGILSTKESDEAWETAALAVTSLPPMLLQDFQEIPVEKNSSLNPKTVFRSDLFQTQGSEACASLVAHAVKTAAANIVGDGARGNALLVVGHQPMLGWISHAIVGEAHSFESSEILCLDLKDPDHKEPVLRWSIAPSNDELLADLREKISKKKDLAGLMGGFITAGIAFLIDRFSKDGPAADPAKDIARQIASFDLTNSIPQVSKLATNVVTALAIPSPEAGASGIVLAVAGACLLLAVILYLFTLFSYDALLMPVRFWQETPAPARSRPSWIVARPPSSAQWILYQNMIHIWQWQFLPGTFLALCGLFMIGVSVFLKHASQAAQMMVALGGPVLMLFIIGMANPGIRKQIRGAFRGCLRHDSLHARFCHVFGPWVGSQD